MGSLHHRMALVEITLIHWTYPADKDHPEGPWACNCKATFSGQEAAQRHEDHPPEHSGLFTPEPSTVVEAPVPIMEQARALLPPSADVPSF